MKKISLQWRLTCIITLYIACLLYTSKSGRSCCHGLKQCAERPLLDRHSGEIPEEKEGRRNKNQKQTCKQDHLALHAVLTKMVFFCIDIIPGQKSDSTCYNQPHNRKINQWISHIRSQGRIQMIRFSKKIKSCIAECGYRMKQRHPDSFSAVIP